MFDGQPSAGGTHMQQPSVRDPCSCSTCHRRDAPVCIHCYKSHACKHRHRCWPDPCRPMTSSAHSAHWYGGSSPVWEWMPHAPNRTYLLSCRLAPVFRAVWEVIRAHPRAPARLMCGSVLVRVPRSATSVVMHHAGCRTQMLCFPAPPGALQPHALPCMLRASLSRADRLHGVARGGTPRRLCSMVAPGVAPGMHPPVDGRSYMWQPALASSNPCRTSSRFRPTIM